MSEAPTRSLDTLRSRPPEELRAIGKMPAKAAGSSIKDFFEANKSTLTALVQGHVTPDRLLGVAMNAIRQTPKLQQCTVASLFGAIVQCAVMRLEPNTFEGHCYLIPRKKNVPVKDEYGNIQKDRSGKWITQDIHEVNVQIGYKGRIELAYRSPKVKSLFTSVIHANDRYKITEGTERKIDHEPKLDGDRGPAIAYYAVAELTTDGRALFDWMSVKDIERVRDNFSEGYRRSEETRHNALNVLQATSDAREQRRARLDLEKAEDNPWLRDFDQMARKTVLNRLDPYLPSTPESSLARALDQRDSTLRSQDLGGVIEGTAMAYDDDEGETDAGQQQIEQTVNVGVPTPPSAEKVPNPREEIKRQVEQEARDEAAQKAAAAEAEQAKKAEGAPGKGKRAPDPTPKQAEDKTAERAQELIDELTMIDGTHMATAFSALLGRGTTISILRAVERDPNWDVKVRDAIVAARKRVEAKQEEPPEDDRFPGDH